MLTIYLKKIQNQTSQGIELPIQPSMLRYYHVDGWSRYKNNTHYKSSGQNRTNLHAPNKSKSESLFSVYHCHEVVGFTTTDGINAYHHWCCEFESQSGWGVQHYVIKFVRDLQQVGGFLWALWFPPSIKLTIVKQWEQIVVLEANWLC
jgi:hypothetical protein